MPKNGISKATDRGATITVAVEITPPVLSGRLKLALSEFDLVVLADARLDEFDDSTFAGNGEGRIVVPWLGYEISLRLSYYLGQGTAHDVEVTTELAKILYGLHGDILSKLGVELPSSPADPAALLGGLHGLIDGFMGATSAKPGQGDSLLKFLGAFFRDLDNPR